MGQIETKLGERKRNGTNGNEVRRKETKFNERKRSGTNGNEME